MPTVTFTSYSVWWDTGQLLSNLVDVTWNFGLRNLGTPLPGVYWTWVFGVWNGYRTIEVHTPTSGAIDVKIYVNMELKADQTMPLRRALMSNNWWNQVGTPQDQTVPEIQSIDWDYARGGFVAIEEMKSDLIQEWTDGEPGAIQYTDSDVVGGIIRSCTAIIPVVNEPETNVVCDKFYHIDWTRTVNMNSGTNVPPIVVGIGNSAPSSDAGLGAIAEALQQIAMQDFNISLNHGQSIFSVKGSVIT